MRRACFALALVGGLLLFSAGSALAANVSPPPPPQPPAMFVPWLSVTPPFARAGDNVVFTVTGPPGHNAALAFSFSNLGAGLLNGQHILLGTDFTVLASGIIGEGGAWTSSVQIPPGVRGEVYLQGAVWPPEASAMTLTNGTALFITDAGSAGIAVAEVNLRKDYSCGSPTTVRGIEFRAIIGAVRPIREATVQVPTTPTPTVYRLLPFVSEPDFWLTPSGYPYILGYEYGDEAGVANLGLFPDGTYTFTATFPDGTTTTTSTVLGGTFPGVPTFVSPGCEATNVSRGPTIQFTVTGADRFDVHAGVRFTPGGHSEDIWRYHGTATTVTVPGDLLWPSFTHGISIEAYAPSATPARKSISVDNPITTGP